MNWLRNLLGLSTHVPTIHPGAAVLPGCHSDCCKAVVSVGPVQQGQFSVWTPVRCRSCDKVLEMICLGRINRANEVLLN